MSSIDVNGVSVQYPVYGVRSRNLRASMATAFLGGAILKDRNDIVYVESLSNVTLSLKSGDRLGVIGENGAGKTTLLRVIAGYLFPTRGVVRRTGLTASIINAGAGLDPDRTGRENATIMALILGVRKQRLPAVMLDIVAFSELGHFFEMPVRSYSAGMILRLSFAISSVIEPNILILDEGILAGDQHFIGKARDRMQTLYSQTEIIVLSSHSMELVSTLCNKVILLSKGKTVFFGDAQKGIELYNSRSYLEAA